MDVEIRNKYLIYNEEQKVLVFYNQKEKMLFVPGYSINFDDFDILIDKVFHKMRHDLEYIAEYERTKERLVSVNNKLKQVKNTVVRRYYSFQYSFDDISLEAIVEYCRRYRLTPYLLSFDEINSYLSKKSKKSTSLESFKDAIKHLQMKLTYEEY